MKLRERQDVELKGSLNFESLFSDLQELINSVREKRQTDIDYRKQYPHGIYDFDVLCTEFFLELKELLDYFDPKFKVLLGMMKK